MLKTRPAPRALMLSPLLALLTACGTPTPPPSAGAAIPPLPREARQPPVPAICSPTCSAALRIELDSLRSKLTSAAPPAQPVSDPSTR
jgi:hypothetical protein